MRFIGNELNERIAESRTSGYVTWILMAACLEGFGWKNIARYIVIIKDSKLFSFGIYLSNIA